MNDLQNEWAILHGNIEKYEQFSLLIKLFSVLLFTLTLINSLQPLFIGCLIATLWLQDGIWKTFQNRLEIRVLELEANLSTNQVVNDNSFQLYSQWQSNRPSTIKLIMDYLSTSLKPTVAYPYVILILLLIVIKQIP